ncbi:MAG: HAMP domain-containing histidine kinase [Clostridia bacterium]|nr:HAMP domain-containing histidine kinase [Clostridia bacterium]
MPQRTLDLKRKLWIYFGMFAIIIVAILWIMQILFLNNFYETMKTSEITRTGKKIVREYKDNPSALSEIVLKAHFDNGLSVGIYSETGVPIFGADVVFYPSSPNSYKVFPEIVSRLNKSGNETVSFVSEENMRRYKSVIFGAKIKSESGADMYLCLTSPLSPMGATTQVLKLQLIIVTVVALFIALILSYFISKRLAKPISNITSNAYMFAEGNYDVRFEHGGYTEINQLADTLNHAASELAKTDALRRDLLANVSHDLRTPLTIIRSYAEMIHDISGSNPEKRNEHASVIVDESDRLSQLVNDILDLSKMESGVLTINPAPFNISDTIARAVNSFSVLAEKNGYTFNVNCEGKYFVTGDEARIQQVIYNLISNAINYTGDDKTVTISTHLQENMLRISVTDTGKGISDEDKALVWDRYYKSSSSHHRMQVGTGIGLSIVKNILLLHKSDFGIISEPGSGSTFWFELPVAENI